MPKEKKNDLVWISGSFAWPRRYLSWTQSNSLDLWLKWIWFGSKKVKPLMCQGQPPIINSLVKRKEEEEDGNGMYIIEIQMT